MGQQMRAAPLAEAQEPQTQAASLPALEQTITSMQPVPCEPQVVSAEEVPQIPGTAPDTSSAPCIESKSAHVLESPEEPAASPEATKIATPSLSQVRRQQEEAAAPPESVVAEGDSKAKSKVCAIL